MAYREGISSEDIQVVADLLGTQNRGLPPKHSDHNATEELFFEGLRQETTAKEAVLNEHQQPREQEMVFWQPRSCGTAYHTEFAPFMNHSHQHYREPLMLGIHQQPIALCDFIDYNVRPGAFEAINDSSQNQNRESSRPLDKEASFRKEVSEKFLSLVNDSCDQVRSEEANSNNQELAVYQCSYPGCSRQFSWLWALKDHEEKHVSKEKTRDYHCEICGKSFFTKSCLKSHLKIHTRKPNSYKCSYNGCTKTYSTSEGLRLHVRNHHQMDKRWECPVEGCEKRFVRQSDMRLHIMRIHAKTRPHPCSFQGCGKSFACYSELRRHEQGHLRKLNRQAKFQKSRFLKP